MSDGSAGSAVSAMSEGGIGFPETEELIQLREDVAVEIEAFKRKLRHGSEIRKWIRNTTTEKDQLRAMVRCVNKCIRDLNAAAGIVLNPRLLIPIASASERLGNDQLRYNAKNLLKFFKNNTVDSFVAAFNPDPTVGARDAIAAFDRISLGLSNCELFFTRVIRDGYDCLTSSEDD